MDARQLHEREAEGFELLAGGGRAAAAQRRDGRGIPSERFYRWAKTIFFAIICLLYFFIYCRRLGRGREPADRGRIFKVFFYGK